MADQVLCRKHGIKQQVVVFNMKKKKIKTLKNCPH